MPNPAFRLRVETNNTVSDVTLSLHIFEPPASTPAPR